METIRKPHQGGQLEPGASGGAEAASEPCCASPHPAAPAAAGAACCGTSPAATDASAAASASVTDKASACCSVAASLGESSATAPTTATGCCGGGAAALQHPRTGGAWWALPAAGVRLLLSRERVVLGLLALVAALAVVAPQRVPELLVFVGNSLLDIAPYLLASVALAAYLRAADADHLIARAFAGNPGAMVVTASLFGALSPFCSCGVIPIIAALLAMGVPLAPVMAFWLSSPVMAPDMYLLTAGELGVGFATAKTIAAVGVGLLGGYATLWLQRRGAFPEPLREGVGNGGCAAAPVRGDGVVHWRVWADPARRARFTGSAGSTAWFLGKWLALAFVLEALMLAYLPADAVAAWLGGGSGWAIPLAVAVGVPAYLNGYAAIPLVGGLMATGMAPGAAMAFMTAGAMTSIPAAVAVFALVRRAVFVWYLTLALAGALLAGLLYQVAVSW